MRWSIENKIRAGFGVALIFLALAGAVAWLNAARGAKAFQTVEHTHAVMAEIETVMTAMLNIENGMNRFVVTGDEKFLQPGYGLREQVSKSLADLRRLTRDDPRQQRRLDQLEALTAQNRLAMAQTIRVRRTNEVAAKELVAGGKSKLLADAMQALIEEMESEETRSLRQRGEAVQAAGQASFRLVEFGGLAALCITAAAGLAVLRGTRRRVQAEQSLRESKESLAVTLQSIGDGVLATDAAGRITRLNAVAEALTGWAQAEAAGRPVAEVFHIVNETTRAPAFLPVADTLAKGTIHGLANHTLIIARDGTERPIADSCAPIRNREGDVIGAVLVFRDVTEQRRAEQALAKSAHEIQDLYNHAPCGYHSVDAEGVFVAVNDTELKWFGRTREELIGKIKHRDLVTPDTRAAYDAGFAYFLEYGEVRDLEFRIAGKDGVVMDVLLNATAARGADGRIRQSRSTMFDITERKQAERKLESALRTNQLIMEHSLDVICTIDGQGRFDFVSAACAKLWGYQPEELVGRQYIDLVHPEDHPATNQAAAAIMAGRPVPNFENRYRRKDGTLIPVMWSASWSAEEQRMFCVAHDVTERKQVEAVLQRAHVELTHANAELDRASRHKDEFLANMSHELRTPLNAILGMSELLTEQLYGPLTPRQAKSVNTIASSGKHLLALINDILDLSKIEAGKMELHCEPLNLDEFCQSCLAFVKTQAMQKQISVVSEQVGDVARVTADPKRFKQILVNLLTNAVKFTPQGGRIGLTVAAPEGEGVVRFTVWDSGIGIASADQTKLFQAFTQVDSGLNRSQEGTGLGLALVAKLVELHGGNVALESEPGKGSRFIVTLPLTSPGEPPPAPEPEAAPVEAPQFRHALIVEDDPPAAEQFVRYLAELSLSSVVHPRGEGVLEAALRERPDVILLDIQLPNESGWVALAKLKEHPQTRDVPVVVVSVVDEPGKARAMGAAAQFTKPVSRAQLAAFLHRPFSPKAEPAPRPAPMAPASGPTILLAEDNEANIETLGAYLKAKGYDLHFALNGLIAVKLARELRPALILMDVQMPMLDGLTAIRELRADATFKSVPIVALTALAMSGDRERCLAAGATDYMSKPVQLKELAELMEKLLGKRDA